MLHRDDPTSEDCSHDKNIRNVHIAPNGPSHICIHIYIYVHKYIYIDIYSSM